MARFLGFVLAVVWLACGPSAPPGGGGGGGSNELGGEGEALSADAGSAPVLVRFTDPAARITSTRGGTFYFTVDEVNGFADKLELLVDGKVATEITGAYGSGSWDASALAEGSYLLQLQATVEGVPYLMEDTRILRIDRTPPEMTLSPANGTLTVAAPTPLRITFSEPIQWVSAESITVHRTPVGPDGFSFSGNPDALALSADGRALWISESLYADYDYQIDLPTFRDQAGNPVSAVPTPWNFRVPYWKQVGEPLSAAAGATDALGPRLAVGSDTLWLSWEEQGQAHVRRFTFGAWEDWGSLPGVSPQLQVLDDVPYVALVDGSGGSSKVRVFKEASVGWEELGTGIALDSAATPSLVFDAVGAPIVASVAFDGTARSVYLHRFSNGAWEQMVGSPLSAKAGASDAAHPATVLAANRKLYVAFDETDAEEDVYLYVFSSGEWRFAQGLTDYFSEQGHSPTLAPDPDGGLWIGLIKDGLISAFNRGEGGGGFWSGSEATAQWPSITPNGVIAASAIDVNGSGTVQLFDLTVIGRPYGPPLPDSAEAIATLSPSHMIAGLQRHIVAFTRPGAAGREIHVYWYNSHY